jgi:hypothetical protein
MKSFWKQSKFGRLLREQKTNFFVGNSSKIRKTFPKDACEMKVNHTKTERKENIKKCKGF